MGEEISPPETLELVVEDDCPNREKFHYFSDGERRIDFILAYTDDHEKDTEKKMIFDFYLNNLKEEFGLDTEKAEGILYLYWTPNLSRTGSYKISAVSNS